MIDDGLALLDVLDTDSPCEMTSMRDSFIRTGEGFIIMFSVAHPESLQHASDFHERVRRVKDDVFPFILVASQCDLTSQRRVTTAEGVQLAAYLGAFAFVEVRVPVWLACQCVDRLEATVSQNYVFLRLAP